MKRENLVLIDTWWNVNPYTSNENAIGWSVLIDTWWNVNSAMNTLFTRIQIVLIDTWWNVNIHNYDSNIKRTKF